MAATTTSSFSAGAVNFGGGVYTITSDGSGGTSAWAPVAKSDVGVDLVCTSGTARVEMTACAPENLANALATTLDIGTLSAGQSATTTVAGASHVRLVATGGVAQLSVRT